ncbi:hypothetical protein VZT92_010324 [Zoarces viviparus]|uniref:Uncharacterized protein n=1 Tax=Zoarces viviparus TaxID=48416 RepID=A0AAW1FDI4_ZOAVI
MGELYHVHVTTVELDMVCEDEDSFCLSIDSLKLLVCQLEEHKVENEATCEAHREKIRWLWGRLGVTQEERKAFNEHMVTSRKRNLEALQAQVQRLEDLQRLKICSTDSSMALDVLHIQAGLMDLELVEPTLAESECSEEKSQNNCVTPNPDW